MTRLTIEQAALASGLSSQTVRRRIKSGEWPAELVRGRWVLDPDQIEEHVFQQPFPRTEEVLAEQPPPPSVDLVPLSSIIHDLSNRLADEAAGRARAEQVAEHLRERLAELRARYEPAAEATPPASAMPPEATPPERRRWWQRRKPPEPSS